MSLNSQETDKAFVSKVLAGDKASCKEFAAVFTGQVSFKVRELLRCNYQAKSCALNAGWSKYFSGKPSCDECLDDYIWFIEYLKNKLKSYKGSNSCSLKTYLFSIINSPWTKTDWLRWKKGRNRPPSVIQSLDQSHNEVYSYLWQGKDEEDIAELCRITLDEARLRINRVKEELIKSGQLDLIESPQEVSIHSYDPETPELQLSSNEPIADSKLIIKELRMIIKESANELPEHQLQLLRYRFRHGLTVKEILGFLKKIGICIIPGKDISTLKETDISYALDVAVDAVLKRLKERYGEASSISKDNLKNILEVDDIGI